MLVISCYVNTAWAKGLGYTCIPRYEASPGIKEPLEPPHLIWCLCYNHSSYSVIYEEVRFMAIRQYNSISGRKKNRSLDHTQAKLMRTERYQMHPTNVVSYKYEIVASPTFIFVKVRLDCMYQWQAAGEKGSISPLHKSEYLMIISVLFQAPCGDSFRCIMGRAVSTDGGGCKWAV